MKTEHYNFPVEFQPIQTTDSLAIVPNRQAVVRSDTGAPIGVVSKKYALVTHENVVDTFREAFKGQKREEKIRTTHNGARMHIEIVLPDITVKVDKGDEMAMRLIVENSYDGSHRLQIIFGAFRFVCSNGMVIGSKFVSLNRRHIGQVTLEVAAVEKQVAMLTDLFKKQEPIMQQMARTPLRETYSSPEDFFEPELLHLPAYITNLALNEYKSVGDESVWDAYNALTSVITRGMKKENPETSIRFGKNAWSAAKALVK